MTYKLKQNCVIRLEDNAEIPMQETNQDYRDYLVFVADGGVPLPADEISIAALRSAKLAEVNRLFQAKADYLTAGYPSAEKETWADQKREALAWHEDNATPTPYLDCIATWRQVDRVVYLGKTYAKVIAYSAAAQYLVGMRQRYADQIAAALMADDLDAIHPAFYLE